MTGPKADAILSRSTDPILKKRKKKSKNEDYIGGAPSRDPDGGLMFRDEDDEWRRRKDELEIEGEDAPSEPAFFPLRSTKLTHCYQSLGKNSLHSDNQNRNGRPSRPLPFPYLLLQ